MGTLSVFLQSGDKRGLLWKFSEEGGDAWNGAESVTIPKISNYDNFTFIFEGVRGDTFLSNIGLDDIKLEEGECPSYGSCSFEDGYCSWHNVFDKRDEFDWELGSHSTSSSFTGPS